LINVPLVQDPFPLFELPPAKPTKKKRAKTVKRPTPVVEMRDGRIYGPLPDDAPIVVSFGVGTDSWGMLIEMWRRGFVPDLIATALVGKDSFGNEHRRFYPYVFLANDWLKSHGFPTISFVNHNLKKKAKHYHYLSLRHAL